MECIHFHSIFPLYNIDFKGTDTREIKVQLKHQTACEDIIIIIAGRVSTKFGESNEKKSDATDVAE